MSNKSTIIELILFNVNKGVRIEDAKKSLSKLNEILSKQEGFVSRETAISKEDQFLDVVCWTDLDAAKKASEIMLKNPETTKIFSIIKEKGMIFEYFEIFNKQQ